MSTTVPPPRPGAPTPAGTGCRIPPQLRRDDLRFIRIPARSKGGPDNEQGWNKDHNSAWNDPALAFYLDDNWNYGVFPAEGSPVVIIDADELSALRAKGALDGIFKETFTVETGGSTPEKRKVHLYIECPGLSGKIVLSDRDGKRHLGEMYAQSPGAAAGYVVGPACVHPSGGSYRVITDKPIKKVSLADLEPLLSLRDDTPQETKNEKRAPGKIGGETLTERYDLRISNVCHPDKPKRSGGEIIGGHPVHGSETGSNIHVNPGKNTWHCMRCGSGGDPAMWIAVEEGIIDCSQAGPGALRDPDLMKRVEEAIQRRGYTAPDTQKAKKPQAKEKPPDPVDPSIQEEARRILREGDPLQYFRDTFAILHSGDRDVLDVFVLAGCAQAAKNSQGIQPGISGQKGSGKTTAALAALHLFPPEYVVVTTFSAKALYYEKNLKPGCVIFSDDTQLAPDLESTIKRAMSSFQTGTRYLTVSKEGGKNEAKQLFLPERTVFVFTSVYDPGDTETLDRQYRIGLAPGIDAWEKFKKFLIELMLTGREELPENRKVHICREMLREIKNHLFRVRVPFAERIHFMQGAGRRDMVSFKDFVYSCAILHFMQRKQIEDEDGVIVLYADEKDFELAKSVFQTSTDTRLFQLTKEERALLDWIVARTIGVEGVPEATIVQEFKKSKSSIRNILYGRDGSPGAIRGGLCGKIPGLDVRQETQHRESEKKSVTQNVVYAPPTAKSNLDSYTGFVSLLPEHGPPGKPETPKDHPKEKETPTPTETGPAPRPPKEETPTPGDDPGSTPSTAESYCRAGGVHFVPDITTYRRIAGGKVRIGSCMFAGCGAQKMWESQRGDNFLCDRHYQAIQKRQVPSPAPEQVSGIPAGEEA